MNKALQEIVKYYECQRCGYCCKLNGIDVEPNDIQSIIKEAEQLGFSLEDIQKQLHFDSISKTYIIKYPCFLYKNNSCLIYQNRPPICKTFPFQVINDIIVIVAGYCVCPMITQFISEFIEYAEKNKVKYAWKENIYSKDSPFLVVAFDDIISCFKKMKEERKIEKVVR